MRKHFARQSFELSTVQSSDELLKVGQIVKLSNFTYSFRLNLAQLGCSSNIAYHSHWKPKEPSPLVAIGRSENGKPIGGTVHKNLLRVLGCSSHMHAVHGLQ